MRRSHASFVTIGRTMPVAAGPLRRRAMTLTSKLMSPEAAAKREQRLEAVRCSTASGAARTGTEERLAFRPPAAFERNTDSFESAPVFPQQHRGAMAAYAALGSLTAVYGPGFGLSGSEGIALRHS